MTVRWMPAALVLAAAAVAGCRPSPNPPARATNDPKAVAAEVDGQPITYEELDKRAAGHLQQLRDQEYEIRRNALDALIDERLLKKAAADRGLSEGELKRVEVDDKVPAPTDQEIRELYDANRDRVGGRSLEEVAPQIVSSLKGQRASERGRAFAQALRDEASVKVHLDQPRIEVPIPAGVAVQGPANAAVTIVEFSDYLCPYCRSAEAVVSKVLERYKGRVKFVHRDLLLGRPRSLPVAEAALCAGEQGKFWEYRHDLLTANGDWSDQDLAGRAARMGLKAADFKACVASERNERPVLESTEGGNQLGVTGTPTYFVNGRRMTGVRSEQQFDEIIRAELRRRG